MNFNLVDVCIASCAGIFATIFGIDLLIVIVWFGVVALDIITGIAKAKVNGKEIISSIATAGTIKKLMPMGLVLGFYLASLAIRTVSDVDLTMIPNSFALFYILIEFKSILENCQEAGIIIPKEMSEKIDQVFNTTLTKK